MYTKISSVSIFIAFMLFFKLIHAKNEKEISILPTIKPPLLVHVNTQANAQYMVKNLSQKNITLALIPQKGISQNTTGLLACPHSISLRPGQKCLLNLTIKGDAVGQKIKYGPLLCKAVKSGKIKPDTSFCAQPSPRDSLNVTFTKPKIAVIEVKPQALTLHAASKSPDKLTVINHSKTITAKNIRVNLPAHWKDVKQNAENCIRVEPQKKCLIYLNAKKPHATTTVSVAGHNTTTIPLKIMVKPHDVKMLGPAVKINDIKK
ncbi:hypothetical protein FOG18_12665 [Legionella israelensis]|uniref:hypothetical protein n=1 Tax=Legionella israelensis TaxID=454 RepID=UPI0011809296|nr:hypothetical protein [Legionella israelensis]QDP73355.1 hypothetical protein FOG18_12665 [Legionella israelensis]